MIYRLIRAWATFTLNLFFRIETPVDPHGGLKLEGPVMYVGNHPNGLIDPGIIFVLSQRQVTFLAKEPLFRMPLIGQMLRGVGALPVYRKQDGADTAKNEGTLTAATGALTSSRAITIFPEGKSHSEPQLTELKTGAARIVLAAKEQGAPQPKIVPVGITYEARSRFRSRVHVEVGKPLEVEGEVRELTGAIADALRAVTLNLEAWEDLPMLKMADQLYALKARTKTGDPERLKKFARGVQLLREEQPERFEAVKEQVLAFQSRLSLLAISAEDLTSRYRPLTVLWFAVRNVLWLLSAPLALCGVIIFSVPFLFTRLVSRVSKVDWDIRSTVKVVTTMVIAPVWWALLTFLTWRAWGTVAGVVTFVGAIPFALFTRVFIERRLSALHDARTFFVLGSRKRLQKRLLEEGRALADEVESLVTELRERV